MTGLLAGITGQFPRRLVLGTLLPVVVFVLAAQIAAAPLVPERWSVAEALAALETEWQLALWTLVTVATTGVLFVLNVPLIRLYEGYPWRESWIGRWAVDRERARLRKAEIEEKFLGHLASKLDIHPRRAELEARRDRASRRRIDAYPKPGSVLPTRLGNVIRAFENYPERQYWMSGIDLWPRLAPLLPSERATSIDAAKTGLDFTLNASFLSAALAALTLATAVLSPLEPGDGPGRELLGAGAAALLSIVLYRASVSRAAAWGQEVKAAFDLHRRDLLEALGFTHEPATLAEERDLWLEISWQIAFLDPWDGSPPTLAFAPEKPAEPPRVASAEGEAGLTVARGVERIGVSRLVRVLRVRNGGAKGRTGVVLVDAPPPGWEYAWGSARLAAAPVVPLGSSTLRFPIGALGAGAHATVRYEITRVHSPSRKESTP